jgi:hypothetical protein
MIITLGRKVNAQSVKYFLPVAEADVGNVGWELERGRHFEDVIYKIGVELWGRGGGAGK